MQTTISATLTKAYPGMQDGLDRFHDVITGIVEQAATPAGIAPGLLCVRGTGGDKTVRVPVTVATDADAISGTAIATSNATQALDTELVGVIGTGRISPARKVTIQRSSHANQDAVTAVLTGIDQDGKLVTENFSFADGGGDTFTSSNYYSYVVSLVIPAQGGSGGTTEIGINSTFAFGAYELMGIMLREHKALNTQSSSDNEVHEHQTEAPVIRRGYVWVTSETTARAGDQAYARAIAAGAELRGAFRAEGTDSGDSAAVPGVRYVTSVTSAPGLALLEINL